MARKTIVQLIDDTDGTEITPGAGGTVRFDLDRHSYELDLTHEHAQQLRDVLAPYIAAGRRIPRTRTSRSH